MSFQASLRTRSAASAAPLRVLIVDDSAIVRSFVRSALTDLDDIEVVGMARNGQEALDRLDPSIDVVLLDVEMPVMDGLTALPKVLRAGWPPPKVVMSSTLTKRGAAISLQALSDGASDYLAKPSAHDADARKQFRGQLVEKIRIWGAARRRSARAGLRAAPVRKAAAPSPAPSPFKAKAAGSATALAPGRPRAGANLPKSALAIGCSTGGPQALIKLLKAIRGVGYGPTFVTQHMPAAFTPLFARQLGDAAGRPCEEGVDGAPVKNGHIYLAPGDFHMTIEGKGVDAVIRLSHSAKVNFCRPAVDPMFDSLAKVYGGRLMAVVLTGMGHDGLAGAKSIVAAGGGVHVQDEASSVVWGMPGAIAQAGLAQSILPLDDLAGEIVRAFESRR